MSDLNVSQSVSTLETVPQCFPCYNTCLNGVKWVWQFRESTKISTAGLLFKQN